MLNFMFLFFGFGSDQAMELDDSDVYTMNKLGQLAFSMEQYAVSQMAFEKVRLIY